MKYLCLICAEVSFMMERRQEADTAKHFEEYRVFTEDLRASGQFIGANRLLNSTSARSAPR